jgi:O-antigen ligase
VSLVKEPIYGLYYMLPFLPYRTMRDHFLEYPLGANVLTILVLCIFIGAILRGKRLPKSKLFWIWLLYGVYLYFSMWLGTAIGNAPAPLWLGDQNFLTWKDYMLIPLILAEAAMVIEDRKAIYRVVFITGAALLIIDRSALLESLTRTWTSFDEDKRSGGPLGFGSNQTGAFLAQFGVFFWGLAQFVQKWKWKVAVYGLVALTAVTTMYTFSRGAYLSFLVAAFLLGLLKDRKLLVLLGVFLLTWQTVVPTAVRERVTMTTNANGQLEASAQERVDLWTNAENSFMHSPIFGTGFATFQFGEHVDNLKDTHNWYVKVLVETGIIGFIFALLLLGQMTVASYRAFRHSSDPLCRGLGLGLLLAICSCMVANFFGDRWTYVEITGLLWVLVAAAIRAEQLEAVPTELETELTAPSAVKNPYLQYR